MAKYQKTDFEVARDELMSHVHRCNVLQATDEQKDEWLADTMDYMSERFPGLSAPQLEELKLIGSRFCSPAIPHGKQNTALTKNESADEATETETDEPTAEAEAPAEASQEQGDTSDEGKLAGAA